MSQMLQPAPWNWQKVGETTTPLDELILTLNRRLSALATYESQVNGFGAFYPVLTGELGVMDVRYPFGYVKRYGALGDGANDDTSAALAAAAAVALAAAPSKRMVYTAGTYKQTAQVTFAASNIDVVFDAGASISGTMTTTSDVVFYANGKSNLRFIQPVIAGTHSWGTYIAGGSGHRILGPASISGGTSPDPAGGKCGGCYWEGVDNVGMLDVDLFGNGDGDDANQNTADILSGAGTTIIANAIFLRVRCRSTAVVMNMMLFNGFRCYVGGGSEFTGAFTPSPGFDLQGYGLAFYNTPLVDRSLVGENTVDGVSVHDVEGSGIFFQRMRSATIANVKLRNVATVQTETTLGVGAIVIDGSPHSTLTGFEITGSGRDGICIVADAAVNQCFDVTIGAGTINGVAATYRGLSLYGPVADIKFATIVLRDVDGDAAGSFSNVAQDNVTFNDVTVETLVTPASSRGFTSCALSTNWRFTNCETTNANGRGFAAIAGTNHVITRCREEHVFVVEAMSADRGDASITVAALDRETQLFATVLTANRTVTVTTTALHAGRRFRVVRTGLGAFTLAVAGLKTIPAATAAAVEVEWDGAALRLVGYQLL